MTIKIKEKVYKVIKDLGYNITDNGDYVENFPWLMLKLQNDQVFFTPDTRYHRVVLALDIFSTYAGEKEILTIVSDITNHLQNLQTEMPELLYHYQRACKILDDKSTGPIRKHGIVNYEFILGEGLIEEEAPEDEVE